jgi:hypothetical protein
LKKNQVRDEVEHLLDHNENMAQLHLSRKQIKCPQDEILLASAALNSNLPSKTKLGTPNSVVNQAMGIAMTAPLADNVGDLEILLESYFMQLDGIRNRIMMVCYSLPNLLHTPYSPLAFFDTANMTVPILMKINYFLAYLTGPRIYC